MPLCNETFFLDSEACEDEVKAIKELMAAPYKTFHSTKTARNDQMKNKVLTTMHYTEPHCNDRFSPCYSYNFDFPRHPLNIHFKENKRGGQQTVELGLAYCKDSGFTSLSVLSLALIIARNHTSMFSICLPRTS